MPKPVEASIDEYLSKRELSVNDGIVYRAAKMPKSFDPETRSAVFVMTDETTDSYGDTVFAKGAALERFEGNPICLLNHRSDLILGNWSDVQKKPKRIEGRATLAAEGTAPHIDMAYGLMSQGILRAASIGFMPMKLERKLDADGEPTWSYNILEWELYECSVVAVPSNPSALAKSIKAGNMLARDFLDEVLDTYTKTASGLIVARADLEAAHKDATGNKTTTTIEATIEPPAWLAEVRELAERMEKAAEQVANDVAALEDRQDAADATDAADEMAKELELNVEEFLKGFEPKVDTITEPERKGALTKLMDGIRGLFKEPEPERADPETQRILRERAEALSARFQKVAEVANASSA